MRSWKEAPHDVFLYYGIEDGRIIGQLNTIAHTKIWIAKILTLIHNQEIFLGQYISYEYALKAVEQYWDMQDKTFLENLYESE